MEEKKGKQLNAEEGHMASQKPEKFNGQAHFVCAGTKLHSQFQGSGSFFLQQPTLIETMVP
jgi:hypothetical protein